MAPAILVDERGRALAEYERTTGAPTPRVDVRPLVDDLDAVVAAAVATQFPGHRVSVVDAPGVAAALVARDGTPGRHMFLMACDLTAPRHARPLPGAVLAPMDPTRLGEYGALVTRAYPPGHPDHEPGDEDPAAAARALDGLLRGAEVGPWLADASFHAVDGDGHLVGAIVVSEMAPWLVDPGGPWVSDVFVDPAVAGGGIGSALLAASIGHLAARGRTSLGLAVTARNPAQHVYERGGFVVRHDVRHVVTAAPHAAGC